MGKDHIGAQISKLTHQYNHALIGTLLGRKGVPNGQFVRKDAGATVAELLPPEQSSNREHIAPSGNTLILDCVSLEKYKLDDSVQNRRDNEAQLLSDSSDVMFNDVRRISINGMTMEKFTTRFWHFNRGHVCTTEPFDCQKQPALLIAYYLNQSFGKLEDLGYDPSVDFVRDQPGGHLRWIYKVDHKEYVTVGEPLAYEARYPLVSRSPRLWKVQEYGTETPGDYKVLKDFHPFANTLAESAIQSDIIHRLGAKAARDVNGIIKETTTFDPLLSHGGLQLNDAGSIAYNKATVNAKRYFLTIEHDQELELSPSLNKSHSRIPWTQPVRKDESRIGAQSDHMMSTGIHDALRQRAAMEAPREGHFALHHHRQHRRMVFKELCQIVYEIPNFLDLGQCIQDVVIALDLLRQAGYVHRDISGGNCMWHEGVGKISDLEYARPYNEATEHEPLTGTPDFMAVETQAGYYLFHKELAPMGYDDPPLELPTARQSRTFTSSRSRKPIESVASHAVSAAPQGKAASLHVRPTGSARLIYNYMHDLESVIWVFYEYWLSHVCLPLPPSTLELLHKLERLIQLRSQFFDHGVQGSGIRQAFILSPETYSILDRLAELDLHHDAILLAQPVLNVPLHRAYTALEQRIPTEKTRWLWDEADFNKSPYVRIFYDLQGAEDSYIAQSRAESLPLAMSVRSAIKRVREDLDAAKVCP